MSSHTIFFFFNDTAPTEIYTLSLHDALPICQARQRSPPQSIRHTDAVLRSVLDADPAPPAGSVRRPGRPTLLVPPSLQSRRRSEEHTSELQSQSNLVCRLLLEKKNEHKEKVV